MSNVTVQEALKAAIRFARINPHVGMYENSNSNHVVYGAELAKTFEAALAEIDKCEGWVSVEDRLPENDKTVICASIPDEFIKLFNSGKYIPATDEIFGACFVWGKWTYEPYGDYESTARVTHWQSLPAAPTDTEQLL